jgi:AcrR family transcriptional regulator
MSAPGTTDLRRVILDTTRHLLVKEGYNNLSMRKIARATGYSATSIYLYFKNKDDLFHALIDEGYEQLYALNKQASEQHPDAVDRLQALCATYVTFGLQNPEYYEIMSLLHPERMARYPASKYRRARRSLDLIASTLTEGAKQGIFAFDDARVTASTIWASLHGFVSLLIAQRMDIGIDRATFIQAAIHHIVRSVHVNTSQTTSTP